MILFADLFNSCKLRRWFYKCLFVCIKLGSHWQKSRKDKKRRTVFCLSFLDVTLSSLDFSWLFTRACRVPVFCSNTPVNNFYSLACATKDTQKTGSVFCCLLCNFSWRELDFWWLLLSFLVFSIRSTFHGNISIKMMQSSFNISQPSEFSANFRLKYYDCSESDRNKISIIFVATKC